MASFFTLLSIFALLALASVFAREDIDIPVPEADDVVEGRAMTKEEQDRALEEAEVFKQYLEELNRHAEQERASTVITTESGSAVGASVSSASFDSHISAESARGSQPIYRRYYPIKFYSGSSCQGKSTDHFIRFGVCGQYSMPSSVGSNLWSSAFCYTKRTWLFFGQIGCTQYAQMFKVDKGCNAITFKDKTFSLKVGESPCASS